MKRILEEGQVNIIGERIKELREKKGYSQQQLWKKWSCWRCILAAGLSRVLKPENAPLPILRLMPFSGCWTFRWTNCLEDKRSPLRRAFF